MDVIIIILLALVCCLIGVCIFLFISQKSISIDVKSMENEFFSVKNQVSKWVYDRIDDVNNRRAGHDKRVTFSGVDEYEYDSDSDVSEFSDSSSCLELLNTDPMSVSQPKDEEDD